MKSEKAYLTSYEQIEVAYWHLVRGYPQQDLAAMYKVNQGRVSEAITAVRKAVGMVKHEG